MPSEAMAAPPTNQPKENFDNQPKEKTCCCNKLIGSDPKN
jgi:hypothetical protein